MNQPTHRSSMSNNNLQMNTLFNRLSLETVHTRATDSLKDDHLSDLVILRVSVLMSESLRSGFVHSATTVQQVSTEFVILFSFKTKSDTFINHWGGTKIDLLIVCNHCLKLCRCSSVLLLLPTAERPADRCSWQTWSWLRE